jgi:hypothetical protein
LRPRGHVEDLDHTLFVELRNPQRIDTNDVVLSAAAELHLGQVLRVAGRTDEIELDTGFLLEIGDLGRNDSSTPGEGIHRPL